ncbi:MAG TPA: phosphatase PAP2 family protein, partial [Longimicrobiales bacterium]|nr:phosphatase PAP2 family protein [Longimicrobiales bacterium]
LIFSGVAHAVHEGVTQSFDEAVLRWLYAHRSPTLDTVMLEITMLGEGPVQLLVVLVAALILYQLRKRASVATLLVGLVGGTILNALLKTTFARPRPMVVVALARVHTTSFPSGHAMSSLVTYGAIAYVTGRLVPEPRLRRTTWILAAILVLAIGISRMYLGVHYPSDVIAGYIAGLAWLAFLSWFITAIGFFARRRMEPPPE